MADQNILPWPRLSSCHAVQVLASARQSPLFKQAQESCALLSPSKQTGMGANHWQTLV